ncbi:MAG: undecaprenyl/decaprenyl-phosphate alpha-N-acetylglucosaminyl 1-phosphate transferase [Candidatus Cloacimonetes bacterium]|nr:undecaprenyl/decaprenyl-phosphate alpha-N-acetylglucosaminyl 1-phosphate transferase [Candidatus Cloacimonadota bacterium]
MHNIVYMCLTVFIVAILFVYSITPLVIKLAHRTNFYDRPAARKLHKKATPLLGGVAVFSGFLILMIYVIFIGLHSLSISIIGYILGSLLIVLVGVIDDRHGMKPWLKLTGQIVSCLIFIASNKLFTLFGPFYLTLPILFFWMVGLMNALNFLDNMDGIITGMSGILALGFYAFSFISKTNLLAQEANYISILSLIFAGAVFGFLPYNFNPAKIFLGDAGSLFIGYFLSTMGILAGRLAVIGKGSNLYFLYPVLLLSFAIFDISLVSITRKRDGRKISQGGKDHSTHRIGTAIGSPKITALIVYLINIIIVLVTIIVFIMDSDKLLIISVIIFGCFFLFFARKLDEVPIVIPENQIRKNKGNDKG